MEAISIRASSMPELFDCPARWEAKYIRGLHMPTNGAAQLGTAVHAGTAVYDQSVLDNAGITIDEAAGAVVDAIHKPEKEVDWGEDSPATAEKIALALHKRYCTEIAPKQHYVAVEATCERLEITDIGIALTGTTDRITVTEDGDYGIADLKTGKRAVAADGTVATAGHAVQIGVYELLAGAAIGKAMEAPAQIIGLQVAKTTAGQRAGIGTIHGARELLVGDKDTPGLLEIVSEILHAGRFYGNPRSVLCSKNYCPAYETCRWRK